MRSARVYAFLVIIALLGSAPVVAQDRTAAPPPPDIGRRSRTVSPLRRK
jgi:hypothetical protein